MKKYIFVIILIFLPALVSCAEREIPLFREAATMTMTYTSGNTTYEGVLTLTEGAGDGRDYTFTFNSPESVAGMKIERTDGLPTVSLDSNTATAGCDLVSALDALSPDEYSVRVSESTGGAYTIVTSTEDGEIELFYRKGEEYPYKINVQAGEIFFSFHIK